MNGQRKRDQNTRAGESDCSNIYTGSEKKKESGKPHQRVADGSKSTKEGYGNPKLKEGNQNERFKAQKGKVAADEERRGNGGECQRIG